MLLYFYYFYIEFNTLLICFTNFLQLYYFVFIFLVHQLTVSSIWVLCHLIFVMKPKHPCCWQPKRRSGKDESHPNYSTSLQDTSQNVFFHISIIITAGLARSQQLSLCWTSFCSTAISWCHEHTVKWHQPWSHSPRAVSSLHFCSISQSLSFSLLGKKTNE